MQTLNGINIFNPAMFGSSDVSSKSVEKEINPVQHKSQIQCIPQTCSPIAHLDDNDLEGDYEDDFGEDDDVKT